MEILQIDSASSWYKPSLELRNDVLRKPLGLDIYEEDLRSESFQIHFVLVEELVIYGVVILVPKTGPYECRLRQMAVVSEQQGKGYGSMLLHAFEQYAQQQGFTKISLHARHHATGFYEKHGFKICSEEFVEVGIPHFRMEKNLS
jgi:predicted GNAT family N-acyltransferase